jgi:pimeloyl-ACP methyl ester carboxylesterase
VRGEFIDLGGSRLYYYAAGTRGAGEPIILLHGFPTSSHLWNDVVPLLPEGHRIVVLDLLGYGRSDRPLGKPVSIKGHADRVLQLLDALNINYACIVGHDLGGGVAQTLAVRAPTRVARLCLVNSVAYGDWPSRELKLARAMLPLTRHLPQSWGSSILRTDLLRGYCDAARGARSIDRYIKTFATPEGRDAFAEHLSALDSAETLAIAPRLKDIVAPTAIVWGREDPFLPRSIAEQLRNDIPDATLELLPNAAHFSPEEAPERVALAIGQLLDRS